GVRLHDDGRSRRGVLDGVPRYVGDGFRQAIRVPGPHHVTFDLQLDGGLKFPEDVSAHFTQISGLTHRRPRRLSRSRAGHRLPERRARQEGPPPDAARRALELESRFRGRAPPWSELPPRPCAWRG